MESLCNMFLCLTINDFNIDTISSSTFNYDAVIAEKKTGVNDMALNSHNGNFAVDKSLNDTTPCDGLSIPAAINRCIAGKSFYTPPTDRFLHNKAVYTPATNEYLAATYAYTYFCQTNSVAIRVAMCSKCRKPVYGTLV